MDADDGSKAAKKEDRSNDDLTIRATKVRQPRCGRLRIGVLHSCSHVRHCISVASSKSFLLFVAADCPTPHRVIITSVSAPPAIFIEVLRAAIIVFFL